MTTPHARCKVDISTTGPELRCTYRARRHWKELMQITGTQLDLTPEVFRLQHLLNAKLIAHRDEVRFIPVPAALLSPVASLFGVDPQSRGMSSCTVLLSSIGQQSNIGPWLMSSAAHTAVKSA